MTLCGLQQEVYLIFAPLQGGDPVELGLKHWCIVTKYKNNGEFIAILKAIDLTSKTKF